MRRSDRTNVSASSRSPANMVSCPQSWIIISAISRVKISSSTIRMMAMINSFCRAPGAGSGLKLYSSTSNGHVGTSAATVWARFISSNVDKDERREPFRGALVSSSLEPSKVKAPRPFQVQGLCREVWLAPEQRQQDDDRQGNTDHPKKNAFTEAHVSLLSLNKVSNADDRRGWRRLPRPRG